jgi:hypothetical protein
MEYRYSMAMGIAVLLHGAEGAQGPVPFDRVLLNPQFYSEGINFGDLDRDGKADLIAGPYWYPGPDFSIKKAFRQPKATPFDPAGDSDCYAVFPYDFDGDGWLDILSFRLPGGAEAVWYRNNQGAAGYWDEHVAHTAVENESAALVDMDGDGRPEVITNSKGYGGWVSPDWTDPRKPWTFRAVTARGSWGAFTHGLGAGDINGDGRMDLIFANGWWEQPADPANAADASEKPWTAHPGSFGGQAAPQEGFGGAQMFAYDVDGDGDNDIVTSQQAHGWGIAWYENRGGGLAFTQHMVMGTAAEREKYGVAFSQLHAFALEDLDGDGLKDIVTGKRKGAHGRGLGSDVDSAAVLYWFRLTRPAGGTPVFEPHRIDATAGVGTQLIVADVNGDRSPDILTARREGAFVFLNRKPFPSGLGPAFSDPGWTGTRIAPRLPVFWRYQGRDALGRSGPD